MIKERIINHLKLTTKIILAIWVFAYLFKSFIVFELNNPFEWIINIPHYTRSTRVSILITFLCFHLLIILYSEVKEDAKKQQNENRSN